MQKISHKHVNGHMSIGPVTLFACHKNPQFYPYLLDITFHLYEIKFWKLFFLFCGCKTWPNKCKSVAKPFSTTSICTIHMHSGNLIHFWSTSHYWILLISLNRLKVLNYIRVVKETCQNIHSFYSSLQNTCHVAILFYFGQICEECWFLGQYCTDLFKNWLYM